MLKELSVTKRIFAGFLLVIALLLSVNLLVIRRYTHTIRPFHNELLRGLSEIEKTSVQDEQIRKIQYYDELLTDAMSSYAVTSERKWKYRYQELQEEWKPVMQQSVDNASGLLKKIFTSLQHTRLLLSGHEFQAMGLVDSGQAKKAAETMEGVVYWQLKQGMKRSLKDYADLRGQADGEVSFIISADALKDKIKKNSRDVSDALIMIIIIILLSAGAVLLFTLRVLRPFESSLRELTQGSEMISEGRFDQPVKIAGQGEIAKIAMTLNALARCLHEKSSASLKPAIPAGEKNSSTHDAGEYGLQIDALKQELKTAHEILKKELARATADFQWYRAAVDFSEQGQLVMDGSGDIRVVNARALQLLGYDADELTGKPFDQALKAFDEKGEEIPYLRRPVTLVLATGVPMETQVRYLNKNGKVKSFFSKTFPIVNTDKITGVVEEFSSADLKNRVSQREEWLISTISQNFKSPLAAIYESVSLICDGVLGAVSDEQKKFLTVLRDDVNRLRDEVDSFLDLIKLKSGNVLFRKEFIDMEELTGEVCRDIKEIPGLENDRVSVAVDYQFKPRVYADRQLLAGVLKEMIIYTFDRTSKGAVEVKLRADQHHVIWGISGPGSTMTPEELQHLLEYPRQADDSGSTQVEMAAVSFLRAKLIVEQHNGRIRAGNQTGRESMLELVLPRLSIRDVFYDKVSAGLQKSIAKSKSFSVILFNFKRNSETAEMLPGDLTAVMLEQVKSLLRSPYDGVVCGNDQILFALPLTDMKASEAVAKRAVKSFKVFLEKGKYPYSVEHKIAVYPEHGGRAEDLLFAVGYV